MSIVDGATFMSRYYLSYLHVALLNLASEEYCYSIWLNLSAWLHAQILEFICLRISFIS
jgi:hypothetical protein